MGTGTMGNGLCDEEHCNQRWSSPADADPHAVTCTRRSDAKGLVDLNTTVAILFKGSAKDTGWDCVFASRR